MLMAPGIDWAKIARALWGLHRTCVGNWDLDYRTVLPCLAVWQACLWWHLRPLRLPLFITIQMHY